MTKGKVWHILQSLNSLFLRGIIFSQRFPDVIAVIMKCHGCLRDNLLMVERTCQIEVRYCNQMLKSMNQNNKPIHSETEYKSSVHRIYELGLNSKNGDEHQGHTKKTKGELKYLNDLNWRSFLG